VQEVACACRAGAPYSALLCSVTNWGVEQEKDPACLHVEADSTGLVHSDVQRLCAWFVGWLVYAVSCVVVLVWCVIGCFRRNQLAISSLHTHTHPLIRLLSRALVPRNASPRDGGPMVAITFHVSVASVQDRQTQMHCHTQTCSALYNHTWVPCQRTCPQEFCVPNEESLGFLTTHMTLLPRRAGGGA